MKYLLASILLPFSLNCHAVEPTDQEIAYVMSGMCSVWSVQGFALKEAKNEGANDFINKYWTDWAKQMDITRNEAVIMCNAILEAYRLKHPKKGQSKPPTAEIITI